MAEQEPPLSPRQRKAIAKRLAEGRAAARTPESELLRGQKIRAGWARRRLGADEAVPIAALTEIDIACRVCAERRMWGVAVSSPNLLSADSDLCAASIVPGPFVVLFKSEGRARLALVPGTTLITPAGVIVR